MLKSKYGKRSILVRALPFDIFQDFDCSFIIDETREYFMKKPIETTLESTIDQKNPSNFFSLFFQLTTDSGQLDHSQSLRCAIHEFRSADPWNRMATGWGDEFLKLERVQAEQGRRSMCTVRVGCDF